MLIDSKKISIKSNISFKDKSANLLVYKISSWLALKMSF